MSSQPPKDAIFACPFATATASVFPIGKEQAISCDEDEALLDDECNELDDDGEDVEEESDVADHSPESDNGSNGPRGPYKFKYPEFEGKQGRNLLYKIVEQIVSDAIYKNWRAYVSYQRAGNDCYVGMSRLYRDMSIKLSLVERTIRWRWEKTLERGLVIFEEKLVEELQPDCSVKLMVRHVKNFEALYDLAYQFLQWRLSPQYIAPTYENALAIRQHKQLALWLASNFDCYRRVLCNNKPGRKPQPRHYEESIEMQLNAAIARDEDDLKSFSKDFSKDFSVDTETEISKINTKIWNSNGLAPRSTDLEKGLDAGVRAIGSTEEQANNKSNDQATNSLPHHTNVHRSTEKTEIKENVPAALPASLPEEHEEPEKSDIYEQREDRDLPVAFRTHLEQIATKKGLNASPDQEAALDLAAALAQPIREWLGDQAHEVRVVNTIKKLIRDSNIRAPKTVYLMVLLALMQTYATPAGRVRKRNPDGSANWMPLFYQKLKNLIPKAPFLDLEVLTRPAEPDDATSIQEVTIENDREDGCDSCVKQQMDDEVVEGVEVVEETVKEPEDEVLCYLKAAEAYGIDIAPEERALIEQRDPQLVAVLVEAVWQHEIDHETQHRWNAEVSDTLKQIVPLAKPVVVDGVSEPCGRCGCSIGYEADDDQFYCVVCDPSWRWSISVRREISAIIKAMPRRIDIADQVISEIGYPDVLGNAAVQQSDENGQS